MSNPKPVYQLIDFADGTVAERTPIVFAESLPRCPCCEDEAWCPIHNMHFADCCCVGPMNAEDEGWELVEIDGVLYGQRPFQP